MSQGFMHANGTFITHMTTAKLFSEHYFGMTERNSKNIAHGSGPDMVKTAIVQYEVRTLTLWNSSCFAILTQFLYQGAQRIPK